MRWNNLIFCLLIFGCSTATKSEGKSNAQQFFSPEIIYLVESRVPISAEMKLKKYPENWSGNLQTYLKKYNVFLGSSAVDRDMSISVELKEPILPGFEAGRRKDFYFKEGYIKSIYHTEPQFPKTEDGASFHDMRMGIGVNFEKGNPSKLSCHYEQDPCGETIFINPQGEVTKVTKEKTQCKKGCGHLVPYRIPGSYFIADNKVRVRKEPSTKSEIITELNKDTPIEVIADAEVYEEVFPHYGTWGKVKLDDGKEGYVYGAFLRAPSEPDVVAIREKAEEWKKKKGWKGK